MWNGSDWVGLVYGSVEKWYRHASNHQVVSYSPEKHHQCLAGVVPSLKVNI